jgi:hypothetical protein
MRHRRYKYLLHTPLSFSFTSHNLTLHDNATSGHLSVRRPTTSLRLPTTPAALPTMSTLQTLTTVPDDEVFDDQVDLFLLSTMISVLGVCEFPGIWVLLAERMGGEEEGFTADNVQ